MCLSEQHAAVFCYWLNQIFWTNQMSQWFQTVLSQTNDPIRCLCIFLITTYIYITLQVSSSWHKNNDSIVLRLSSWNDMTVMTRQNMSSFLTSSNICLISISQNTFTIMHLADVLESDSERTNILWACVFPGIKPMIAWMHFLTNVLPIELHETQITTQNH